MNADRLLVGLDADQRRAVESNGLELDRGATAENVCTAMATRLDACMREAARRRVTSQLREPLASAVARCQALRRDEERFWRVDVFE